jgi:hypothetical protein
MDKKPELIFSIHKIFLMDLKRCNLLDTHKISTGSGREFKRIYRKMKKEFDKKKKESLHTDTRENNSKSRGHHYPPIWLIQFEWIAINHS